MNTIISEVESIQQEGLIHLSKQIARAKEGGEGFHNPFQPWLHMTTGRSAGIGSLMIRDFVVENLGWGVYSEESLQRVADFAPEGIVEVGAGNGAWAYGLKQLGVEVEAFDLPTPTHGKGHEWHPIRRDLNHEDAAEKAAREGKALMLVWPSMERWPTETLLEYEYHGGRKVIYVGEGCGGCNADDGFFTVLGRGRKEFVYTPYWYGLHDEINLITYR